MDYEYIIVSFDIGIKNLAYCMIGWTGENYTVIDWKVSNIMPDLVIKTCDGILKNSNLCGKKAQLSSNGKNYCKTHAKNIPDTTAITFRKIPKINNHELNTSLVKVLDTFPHLLNCDEIILEHQPSRGSRMKNVSFMLYSYFVVRLVDKPESRCKHISHRQINSVKKLSIYDGPEITCNLKNQYSRNKYYSKEYCRHMIKTQDEKWINYFNDCKKNDDLADCFLQGVWYLFKKFKF
jgi:hypothetical protein